MTWNDDAQIAKNWPDLEEHIAHWCVARGWIDPSVAPLIAAFSRENIRLGLPADEMVAAILATDWIGGAMAVPDGMTAEDVVLGITASAMGAARRHARLANTKQLGLSRGDCVRFRAMPGTGIASGCAAAHALSGQAVAICDYPTLPLPGCDAIICGCSYGWIRFRED